jgi:hypothetical protein
MALALALAGIAAPAPAGAGGKDVKLFAVNEYFGMEYDREPVSFDVTFAPPVPERQIGLRCDGNAVPRQVEVVEGRADAVAKARVWATVSVRGVETEVDERRGKETVKVKRRVVPPEQRHRLFTVTVGDGSKQGEPAVEVKQGGKVGGVEIAEVGNGIFRAKVPVGGATFETPVSAFGVPGPVVSVSRDGKEWIGDGYLDAMRRVTAVECQTANGPVYFESRIVYRFEDGRSYAVAARVYAGKPYVRLVEDFDVGGDSRFIFSYGDWPVDGFFRTEDHKQYDWWSITHDDPAGDFVKIAGQKCLARMVIWSQHGYFRGKQEAIGLKAPDRKAMNDQYAVERAEWQDKLAKFPALLEQWKKNPKGEQPTPPAEPVTPVYEEIDHAVDGAAIRTVLLKRPGQQRPCCTPGGESTAVGAFYIRPDRWTRAKVNHVDLYLRPEAPAEKAGGVEASRRTRGVTGLAGAKLRPAMEAWLVDGHREWAIYAVPSGDRIWHGKAYVREGVWPLDRIVRLPLAWNADGSPVRPEDTRPNGTLGFGGDIATVMHSMNDRAGVQHFNGSNPSMRGGYAKQARTLLDWAKANSDKRSAGEVQKLGKLSEVMAGPAMAAYMAMDDSAYPGVRAMLPWADPEALNPFYQGMENMNFNIDRYVSVLEAGVALEAMGHPQAKAFIDYARVQLDMGLDRYVYPESGCWEECMGYAGSILRASHDVAREFRHRGVDYLADPRVIRAYRFWTRVLSPADPGFGGMRIVTPIGDHGLSLWVHVARFQWILPDLAKSPNPDSQRLARQLVWSLEERKCPRVSRGDPSAKVKQPPLTEQDVKLVEGLKPEPADLTSRWVQGYGSTLRGIDARGRESFLVVRAEQSWGHHHEDKGSLWGWFRNVHFFGDAAWGAPPGPTYGNPYKQGPASGTQIEFVGVNNWPLPCKYPAPWIADDEYAKDYDYCMARCLYPYNPAMDLSGSTPAAVRNGYDRQVMLVHPDVLVVRDNVETTCPTIWRLHSYHVDGTKVETGGATLASPQGVTGRLAMVHPPGVKFTTSTVHDLPLNDGTVVGLPFGSKPGGSDPHKGGATAHDTRSMVLRWNMPKNVSVTWTFAAHEGGEKAAVSEKLDEQGRVTRVTLSDGTRMIVLMNAEPFAFKGDGIDFEGTVGLVVSQAGKTPKAYPVRAKKLEVR